MGDLERDTAVEALGDGRYRATLSAEWEIWGPMGGYLAGTALRAAGCESRFDRPASIHCHFLGVAAFDTIDIVVERRREARTAEAVRVSVTQGDRAILDASVWSVGEVDGLEHADLQPPDVPDPLELPTMAELAQEHDLQPPFPFWNNVEARPLRWRPDWPPEGPLDPVWRQWMQFVPTATFDDPWVDAVRSLLFIDLASWPSASGRHAWRQLPMIAPTLDVYAAFHEPAPTSGYLLADGHAPVAADGLIGFTTRIWSEERRLVASGGGQMLCRRVSPT
jgi:acyl-CoA thioesterase